MNLPDISSAPVIAIDSETTGLRAWDKPFGVSVAVPGFSGYWDIRQQPQVVPWLRKVLSGRSTIVAHNLSFDYRMLASIGIVLDLNRCDDTVTRACLIDEHLMSYSLDDLAKKYLNRKKDDSLYERMAALLGGKATRNVQMAKIDRAPAEMVAPYAIRDAELVLDLYQWQEKEIQRQRLHQIVDFERGVMPTLVRMEMRGIRVDVEAARCAQEGLTEIIDGQQRELEDIFGRKINTNSPAQVRELFRPEKRGSEWVVDGNHVVPSTGGGAPSLGAAVLRNMTGDRRAELVLAIRSGIKTRDTFLQGHVIDSAHNGRVYPTINQSKGEDGGTGTGRLSITKPAMQQIPSRNKSVAAIVKPVFLPDEGHVWLDSDLASNEVRIFGHLVNDPYICATFAENKHTDFHQLVADMTGLPRNATYSGEPNAKQLNLGAIFNRGNGAIAVDLGLPWEWSSFTADDGEIITYKKAGPEAMEVINRYHNAIPGVKRLAKAASDVANNRGYIRTHNGRRLRFPDKHYLYKASGLLIQATAADVNKTMLVELEKKIEQFGGHLTLNTHDSYSMSLPKADWVEAWHCASQVTEEAFPWLRVPILLELSGVGSNWWAALQDEYHGKPLVGSAGRG